MSITSKAFGKTPAGESVQLFTLKNSGGMEVHIMSYGGIITKILTPDKNGKIDVWTAVLTSKVYFVGQRSKKSNTLTCASGYLPQGIVRTHS